MRAEDPEGRVFQSSPLGRLGCPHQSTCSGVTIMSTRKSCSNSGTSSPITCSSWPEEDSGRPFSAKTARHGFPSARGKPRPPESAAVGRGTASCVTSVLILDAGSVCRMIGTFPFRSFRAAQGTGTDNAAEVGGTGFEPVACRL
jgi:hypothetical protein